MKKNIFILILSVVFIYSCGGIKTDEVNKDLGLAKAEKVAILGNTDVLDKSTTGFEPTLNGDKRVNNRVKAQFYYLKAVSNRIKAKDNPEEYKEFIKNSKLACESEDQTEYLAHNLKTDIYDYFETSEAQKEAVASKTHDLPITRVVEKKYTKLLEKQMSEVADKYLALAYTSYGERNYEKAADYFQQIYNLQTSKYFKGERDYTSLFNAANANIENKNFDKAVEQFQVLVDSNFTGVKTVYEATMKSDGKKYAFKSKKEMDASIKAGIFHKDTTYLSPDLRLSIYQQMSSILLYKLEKYDDALTIIKKGREKFPSDQNLLAVESNIYLKQGKEEEFIKIMDESIANNPKEPSLYFNKGVILNKLREVEKDKDKKIEYKKMAKESYDKAIEVDSKYIDAYLNNAVLILSEEKEINDKLSNIRGYSSKDRKKIKTLDNRKKEIYRESVNYLEKAKEIDSNNVEVLKTLKNIYYQLDKVDKFKEIKALLDKL